MQRAFANALISIAALVSLAACASTADTVAQSAIAETDAVQVLRGEWQDAARNRVVPYKIYLPASRAPAPVIIFSHGLGGSREAASYLLAYLAENGFVVVAIQHPGSDASVYEGERDERRVIERLQTSIADPLAAIARFGDVRFVIDQLEQESVSGPLNGRLDLSHLGMSGHSYGALTTLVAVGEKIGDRASTAFQDSRIDAAIVYSPNAPRNQNPASALGDIATPILHFTGTEDRTVFDLEETPEGRQIPFRTIGGADQYLIVFDGGDHMIFSGRVQAGGAMNPAQTAQTQAIEQESLLFWRAHLMGDAVALAALCELPARLDAIGEAEVRAARCAAAND